MVQKAMSRAALKRNGNSVNTTLSSPLATTPGGSISLSNGPVSVVQDCYGGKRNDASANTNDSTTDNSTSTAISTGVNVNNTGDSSSKSASTNTKSKSSKFNTNNTDPNETKGEATDVGPTKIVERFRFRGERYHLHLYFGRITSDNTTDTKFPVKCHRIFTIFVVA